MASCRCLRAPPPSSFFWGGGVVFKGLLFGGFILYKGKVKGDHQFKGFRYFESNPFQRQGQCSRKKPVMDGWNLAESDSPIFHPSMVDTV